MSDDTKCPECSRPFSRGNDLWQHMKAKHPRAKKIGRPAAEESMADQLIDAQISRAMGEGVPDYLADMFPDDLS